MRLALALAVLVGACQIAVGQAQEECTVEDIIYGAPPVVPIGEGRTWAEVVAQLRGCRLDSKLAPWEGLPVYTAASDTQIGETAGILTEPITGENYVRIVTSSGFDKALKLSSAPNLMEWDKLGRIDASAEDIVTPIFAWDELNLNDKQNYAFALSLFSPYDEMEIDFTSTPPGATVWVAGYQTGKTQTAARVEKDKVEQIVLTLDGYESCEFSEGEFKVAESQFIRSSFVCELVAAQQ